MIDDKKNDWPDKLGDIEEWLQNNKNRQKENKTTAIGPVNAESDKSVREKAAKKYLLMKVREMEMPEMELEMYRAFEDGMEVSEIEGKYYLKYDEGSAKYKEDLSRMKKGETTEWTVEISFLLAILEPDGRTVKEMEVDRRYEARKRYLRKLGTLALQSKIYEGEMDIPKEIAEVYEDDAFAWKELIRRVSEYDRELAELLIYARAGKCRLEKSEKHGYVLSSEQMSDGNKKIYEEEIKPRLMEAKEKIIGILKEIADKR